MDVADYLFLLLSSPQSWVGDLNDIGANSGLTASEISAVLGPVRRINYRLEDLQRCRAAAFALDAALPLKKAVDLSAEVNSTPGAYASALINIAAAAVKGMNGVDGAVRGAVEAVAPLHAALHLEKKKAA